MFELDDMADSCKTYTNHCRNLSIRLSCAFVQSHDLHAFLRCRVNLAWRLTYNYL